MPVPSIAIFNLFEGEPHLKGPQLRGRPPRRHQFRHHLVIGTALLLLSPLVIPAPGVASDPVAEMYEFHGSALPYYFCVQASTSSSDTPAT